MNQINISFPETLAFSLKMQEKEFEKEIKTVSLVKFYELGKISSGFAAKILDVSRIDFLDILADYGISSFACEDELESDITNA